MDGISRNRIDRALAAYSHLDGGPADLFWAMLAIEALFTQTSVAVQQQVVQNTQLLLGNKPGIKKRLDKMYNFRSRLVHGDLDLPGAFREWDSCREPYAKGYEASLGLAMAIVIATFQELAHRGWNELRFKYVLDPP